MVLESLSDEFNRELTMSASISRMDQGVTLYTSLPPRLERLAAGRECGVAYQRECIASWRRVGFDVVSLNPRAEIEILSPLGFDVTFREVASKRPRISDFFAAIKEEAGSIGGIINADCMIIANDPAISSILKAARQGLVLLERINITAQDQRATGVSCCGFDLFLFATHVLEGLEFDPEISIGTPWWDYWFPIAYHLAEGQLFQAPAPLLMHLDHQQSWSLETWLAHGNKMHACLARKSGPGSPLPFLNQDRTNELSGCEAGEFAIAAFQWLKASAQVIPMEDLSAQLWCSFLAGADSAPRQVIEGERQLEEAERRFEEVEYSYRNSLSWKVTRPLRGIEKAISRVTTPTRAGQLAKPSGGLASGGNLRDPC